MIRSSSNFLVTHGHQEGRVVIMYNCITIVQLYSLLGDAVHTWKSRRRVFLKMSVSDWVERVFKFYMCVGMYFPCFLCVCVCVHVCGCASCLVWWYFLLACQLVWVHFWCVECITVYKITNEVCIFTFWA